MSTYRTCGTTALLLAGFAITKVPVEKLLAKQV